MQEQLQAETIDTIRKAYQKRAATNSHLKYSSYPVYTNYVIKERQRIYAETIHTLKKNLSELSFLEVGAGNGDNIPYIKSLGFAWENIYINELLPDRVNTLQHRFSSSKIYPGDALDLPFEESFDIIMQSTVFSSIPSEPFRLSMARKMWSMLKDDGVILWYDFVFDNPNNPDVRKVTRKDVLKFFPEAKSIDFRAVTLAPPIGRRIGDAYTWMNALFPFLRSHLIAVIRK